MQLNSLPAPLRSFKRIAAALRHIKHEYDDVQGEATAASLRRGRVLVAFAVPIHALAALWCMHYQAQLVEPHLKEWATALAWLEGGVSAALAVCGILVHWVLRTDSKVATGPVGLALVCTLCIVYLAFGIGASVFDVGVGNGIGTWLSVTIGVAVLALIRPAVSLLLFASAFMAFWKLLDASNLNSAVAAGVHIQAIILALLAQLISVMMWHQYSRTTLLGRQLASSNEALVRKQLELEALAERDALTGLYNRRKFWELAELELARAVRVPCEISLVMVDIDFFKQVNDIHGHPVGDQVLREVANRLSSSVRSTDIVARIGGEEFVALLPDTSVSGALMLAEKLRQALRCQPLEVAGLALPITASFGVSNTSPHQRIGLDRLYETADQALYTAKKRGRDRVEYGPQTFQETTQQLSRPI